jgi:hypothetical protein
MRAISSTGGDAVLGTGARSAGRRGIRIQLLKFDVRSKIPAEQDDGLAIVGGIGGSASRHDGNYCIFLFCSRQAL